MRPCIEQSNGLVSLLPFPFWPDCIINTSGYDFRKGQAPMTDPIFAEIETHRRLETEYDTAIYAGDSERARELGNLENEQLAKLVAMTPTTVAGCAAMLRHVQWFLETNSDSSGGLFDGWPDAEEQGATLLGRIADTLAPA
jgi:hypothetical protein